MNNEGEMGITHHTQAYLQIYLSSSSVTLSLWLYYRKFQNVNAGLVSSSSEFEVEFVASFCVCFDK